MNILALLGLPFGRAFVSRGLGNPGGGAPLPSPQPKIVALLYASPLADGQLAAAALLDGELYATPLAPPQLTAEPLTATLPA